MKTEIEIKKVVRIGLGKSESVFVEIRYHGGKLSLSGVEGPTRNGDAKGGCGQIVDHIDVTSFAAGWNAKKLAKLVGIWNAWHLNDMRAGCAHQRAAKWDERPIDPAQPTNRYISLTREGDTRPYYTGWNMLTWIHRAEHPQGLLCEPCPECGYKYGSAWLREDVPDDVIEWLDALPASDLPYPWTMHA